MVRCSSRPLDAIDRVNLPEGADRRPAPAVLLEAAFAAEVLAIEERWADEAQLNRLCEIATPIRGSACERAVEPRTRGTKRGMQIRHRDLHDDAIADAVARPLRQLDVPVAVLFRFVDAPRPSNDAENPPLYPCPRCAPEGAAWTDLGRAPTEHRADRHRLRRAPEERH